jgi:DNA-directed RNA polymerase subunit RPC12/RpoP
MPNNPLWKLLRSRPILDIQNPDFDLTPPIESIDSIERRIKNAFQQPLSVYGSLTKKDVEWIAKVEHERSIRDAKEREETGEPPPGEYCDECGKELGEDRHKIKNWILDPEEYFCDDCYRKRYGPYKCRKCGKEFSSGEIDWDESDKEEDSYICTKCSWKEQYGDISEDDHDDEPASW